MGKVIKFISFMIFWLMLNPDFSGLNIFFAFVFCGLVLWIDTRIFENYEKHLNFSKNLWRILWFMGIVGLEIFKAAFQHIIRIINGSDKPVIMHISLDIQNPIYITLIANAITLTPGTLTIKAKNNVLTIVGFANNEKEKNEILHTILYRFQKPFLH